MKQKILYLITKSNWGGAQKYVFELASAASEEGYDVTVGLGGNGVLKEKLENNKIKVIEIFNLDRDISLIKEIKVFFSLITLLRTEKPNILHLNSSKIGALGALAGRLTGITRIIYTAHGWAFNENISFFSKLFRKFASWITIICSHIVIVLSKKEKQQVEAWLGARKKLTIIPIGLKPFDVLSRDAAREQLGIRPDVPVVGMIAELTRNKGIDLAIRAFKKIPDTALVVIGSGEELESLKLKIQSEKLEDRIFLAGHIPNASSLLQAFDVLLIASRKEGLPYVLLEAGYVNVPVIATAVGGIPEVIVNDVTGKLIAPENPEAILHAVYELTDDARLATALSKKLHAEIKTTYMFDTMRTRTIALYGNNATIG